MSNVPLSRRFGRRLFINAAGKVNAEALAQADAGATPPTPTSTGWDYTPPPIPQPLPSPGGTPPALVGAAPDRPDAPVSGAPTSVENPTAAGTPGVGQATPVVGGEIPVTNPQQPAQPLATPVVVGEEAEAPPPVATVALTPDFRFDPPEVTIRVGESVEWRNDGRSPQTVTGDPARVRGEGLVVLPDGAEPWDSGVLNFGATYVHQFTVPGEYAYASMPQAENGMVGRVLVEE